MSSAVCIPRIRRSCLLRSLSDINDVDDSIVTGEGFQTIEAVDVNGDGIDEIVKVNFDGIVDTSTRLLITVYRCNSTGIPGRGLFVHRVGQRGAFK